MWMITGDNDRCAKAVANAVGIDHYAASCYPSEKRDLVQQLQCPITDTPALEMNSLVTLNSTHIKKDSDAPNTPTDGCIYEEPSPVARRIDCDFSR